MIYLKYMDNTIAIISTTDEMYESFNRLLIELGLSYPNTRARMQKSLQVARKAIINGARVIISRGRTAQFLKNNIEVPVVSLSFEPLDYMSSLLQVDSMDENIMYFDPAEDFINMIGVVNRLFGTNLKWCRFDWEDLDVDEVQPKLIEKLKEIRAEGIDTVIGGIATDIACRNNDLGIKHIRNNISRQAFMTTLYEAQYSAQISIENEERQSVRQMLLNSVSEIAFTINNSGHITECNNAAMETFGEDIEEKTMADIFPDYNLLVRKQREKNGIFNSIFHFQGNAFTVEMKNIVAAGQNKGAIVIAQNISKLQSMEQNLRLAMSNKGLIAKNTFSNIICNSATMERTISMAKRFALSDSTILITGESGTGKEIITQSIHNYSDRANKPFVAINCAAIPSSILESELFGYVKGAFTGAVKEGKQGIFELAHKGTIFLDEISEIPLALQARLLRVIQEREIMRIGDDKIIPVDVRIIASSNRDLKKMVEEHKFRSDLYYRINVLELELPPLRERKEDIGPLATFFASTGKHPITLSDDLLGYLANLPLPGNVRQLRNIIEQLSVLSDKDEIGLSDAMGFYNFKTIENESLSVSRESGTKRFVLSEYDRIVQALHRSGGNRAKAAKELGVSTATLWRIMKRLEEDHPDIFMTNYKLNSY